MSGARPQPCCCGWPRSAARVRKPLKWWQRVAETHADQHGKRRFHGDMVFGRTDEPRRPARGRLGSRTRTIPARLLREWCGDGRGDHRAWNSGAGCAVPAGEMRYLPVASRPLSSAIRRFTAAAAAKAPSLAWNRDAGCGTCCKVAPSPDRRISLSRPQRASLPQSAPGWDGACSPRSLRASISACRWIVRTGLRRTPRRPFLLAMLETGQSDHFLREFDVAGA